MDNQLIEIFKKRDRAVAEKDQVSFLSTQIGEIPDSLSESYLKIDNLSSKILYVQRDEKNSQLWVVLVQEDYFKNDAFSHRGYLLYKLVDKNGKLLISEIAW